MLNPKLCTLFKSVKKSDLPVFFIFLGIFIVAFPARAQDIAFSQFFNNQLFTNPSSAGLSGDLRLSIAYRNVWSGVAGFHQGNVSADRPVHRINGGLGVQFSYQQNGLFTFSGSTASYSYQIKLNPKYTISFGLKAGFVQFSRQSVQIESNAGIESIPAENITTFDAGMGFIVFSKKQYLGFSADHLTQPLNPFEVQDNLNYKFTLQYGGFFPVHKFKMVEPDFSYSPNILIQKQGSDNLISPGMYVVWKQVSFGSWVRLHYPPRLSSLILFGGFYYGSLRFGYTYDIHFNHTLPFQLPSNEINLTFYFPIPEPEKKIKCPECPSF